MKVTKAESLKLFRNVEDDGFFLTDHFQQRSVERGFTMEDVFEVAVNGKIISGPKYNPDHNDHSYTIKGKNIDGKSIKIVFGITAEKKVKLITGYKGYK